MKQPVFRPQLSSSEMETLISALPTGHQLSIRLQVMLQRNRILSEAGLAGMGSGSRIRRIMEDSNQGQNSSARDELAPSGNGMDFSSNNSVIPTNLTNLTNLTGKNNTSTFANKLSPRVSSILGTTSGNTIQDTKDTQDTITQSISGSIQSTQSLHDDAPNSKVMNVDMDTDVDMKYCLTEWMFKMNHGDIVGTLLSVQQCKELGKALISAEYPQAIVRVDEILQSVGVSRLELRIPSKEYQQALMEQAAGDWNKWQELVKKLYNNGTIEQQ